MEISIFFYNHVYFFLILLAGLQWSFAQLMWEVMPLYFILYFSHSTEWIAVYVQYVHFECKKFSHAAKLAQVTEGPYYYNKLIKT
jgi:hypothetical protein